MMRRAVAGVMTAATVAWLAWNAWSFAGGGLERVRNDARIGALDDPRARYRRCFPGLGPELRALDEALGELRAHGPRRVLMLTAPGWNPLVATATYHVFPAQIITQHQDRVRPQELLATLREAGAEGALYRTSAGWQYFAAEDAR